MSSLHEKWREDSKEPVLLIHRDGTHEIWYSDGSRKKVDPKDLKCRLETFIQKPKPEEAREK